jgi:plastocyanin
MESANRLIHVFILSAILTLVAMIAMSACNSSSPSPTSPPAITTATVVMQNRMFSPQTITVTQGATITWQNKDSYTHTATSNTGAWNTGDI